MAAILALAALLGAWSLGVLGCTAGWPGYARMHEASGSVLGQMRLSPGEISRLQGNAHYYQLMGRPELGLKEMEIAHQQNPDNLQIVNLLAKNYEELGEFQAARQLYQEALTRHGVHSVIANNLCFSYYQEERWQEAETCFRQALARDPNNVSARNNLGLLCCRLGRQDEARQLWQEAEGVAAAEAKLTEALAALGMTDRPVYARRTESGPKVTEATQAATPKPALSPAPAPAPAKDSALAQTVTPKVSTPPAPARVTAPPAPVKVHTPAQPVSPKTLAPQLAIKPPAKTSAPVAAKTQKETEKQSPVVKPALPAVKATSAPTPKVTAVPLAAQVPAAEPASAQPRTPIKTAKQVAKSPAARTPERVKALPPANIVEAADPLFLTSLVEAMVLCYPSYLTCAELVFTPIEVRNGTSTKDLARHTRSRLLQEGFTVAKIGNHVDFGVTQTTIYYRPGAERVAKVVASAFFPGAGLEPSQNLKKGMDVKILLGADLLQRPQLMARLVDHPK